MERLYSRLNSLVPHSTSKGDSSLPDQLNEAENYIKKLKTRVEALKGKKESLQKHGILKTSSSPGSIPPEILIHRVESALEVVVISNKSGCQAMFNEIVRVLQVELGAEVLNANFSIIGDIAFHTIHAEVDESNGNNGTIDVATIREILEELLHDT